MFPLLAVMSSLDGDSSYRMQQREHGVGVTADDRRVSLGEELWWRHGGQRWMSFISIQWRKDLTAGKIFLI